MLGQEYTNEYTNEYTVPRPSPPDPEWAVTTGGGRQRLILAVVGAVIAAVVAFFAVRAFTGGNDTGDSDNADSDNAVALDDQIAESVDDSSSADGSGAADAASDSATTGDDFACVTAAVDPSLLPAGVSSLEELYATNVSGEAGVAYVNADFACHPEPLGSDAFTSALGGNLELGTGNVIDLDATEVRCVSQYLVDTVDDPARVIAIGDTEADVTAMRNAMEFCFDEADAAYVRGDAGAGPQAYGDDARLDALYDECTDGDERTCDLLWVYSTEGSEYSELAFDCAGRGATVSGLCTPEIDLDVDGFADVTSTGVATLTDECRDGDLTSCDLLAAVAPPGSKTEDIGRFCGGLAEVIALPDCRTELAE